MVKCGRVGERGSLCFFLNFPAVLFFLFSG